MATTLAVFPHALGPAYQGLPPRPPAAACIAEVCQPVRARSAIERSIRLQTLCRRHAHHIVRPRGRLHSDPSTALTFSFLAAMPWRWGRRGPATAWCVASGLRQVHQDLVQIVRSTPSMVINNINDGICVTVRVHDNVIVNSMTLYTRLLTKACNCTN